MDLFTSFLLAAKIGLAQPSEALDLSATAEQHYEIVADAQEGLSTLAPHNGGCGNGGCGNGGCGNGGCG